MFWKEELTGLIGLLKQIKYESNETLLYNTVVPTWEISFCLICMVVC
jgi:hypothetical protein